MAENRTGTSAATRNTEYFAVVDKLYKPNDGEKVFDIYGQRILVKNPEALENFRDMAKFWHTFADKVFFPIDNLLYNDPNASIIQYKFNLIDLISEIDQNEHDKMRRRPANKDVDFSTLTFGDMYEHFIGTKPQDDMFSVFNEYEEDLKAFGPRSEQIQKSISVFRYGLANFFQRMVAVYTFCLKQYGYNIYTPYKINNGDFDYSGSAAVYKAFIKVWMTSAAEDEYKDFVLDLICLDPYFMGLFVFDQIIRFNFSENKDIKNAVTLLDPAFAANWDKYIVKVIDQFVKIPFSYDKEKLMKDLIDARTMLEYDHQRYGLPENVVSPKLREVREKIGELEREKEWEADRIRRAEEKKAARANRANEVKPDKASVGWVLLVLFLLGPFGIIPAIVFFKSKRPKRALCCLIPALVWILPVIIMNIAAAIYVKNNPVSTTPTPVDTSIAVDVTTAPENDHEDAPVDDNVYDEPEELAEIVSDILGSDIPIISGTDEYQIYQATMKYFDNVRNHKLNHADISESELESLSLSSQAQELLLIQFSYAKQLQEIFALAEDDSVHRILYNEVLSHLDTVHAVLKTIEIDSDDEGLICPPFMDEVAFVTLDIYYVDYLPVFMEIANKLNSAAQDDDELTRLFEEAYQYYKDEIPDEEMATNGEALIKSALLAYLFRENISYAEPKVETDVMATLWHRESGWEMELVGLPIDTGMNIYTAGLYIHPEY